MSRVVYAEKFLVLIFVEARAPLNYQPRLPAGTNKWPSVMTIDATQAAWVRVVRRDCVSSMSHQSDSLMI